MQVDYRNVTASKQALEEMLRHSGGRREVPVIVHQGKVEIGWQGFT